MEFIPSQTLQQKLDQIGPLDVAEVVKIGLQIASGLEAAHSTGLIHRDIKPGNILLEQGKDRIKITDFGLARTSNDASLTQSIAISGTPLYMSPEQAQGQVIDQRSDLFSLGSVLYVMCSGRPPFRASTCFAVLKRVVEDQPRPIKDIIPEVPEWLAAIVTKLHAKKPEDRFQSAKEVADLLSRCQSELQLKGEVTCVPPNIEHASCVPIQKNEASVEPRASGVALPEPSKVVVSGQQTTPSAKRQDVPHRLTAKSIMLSLVLGMLVLSPILFGQHFSSAFNKWLWPAIPTLPPIEVATGLRFDGKDDYVKVGPINLSSPQYTLEAFVTSSGDGDNGVIALLNGVEKEPELIYLYDGYPGRERKSGAGIVGQRPYQSVNAPLPSGIREHRALVVDGQAMHYFVNGIWQGKRSCTARKGLMWEMRELHLGCMANQTQFFRGQIDQLRLSKIARYNNNFTVASRLTSDDSTLALYNFDEGQGDVLNDSSSHGHHGKIVGATWASPNSSPSSLVPAESIDSTSPDRHAAEYVLSVGGMVRLWDGAPWITEVPELPLEKFQLREVRFQASRQASDAGLKSFKGCVDLTLLNLVDTSVSDVGLENFQDCKALAGLHLDRTQASDVGMAYFKDCKNLRLLTLANTKVTDAGLVHFNACKDLQDLILDGTSVTHAGLANFKDCTKLKTLWLQNNDLTDTGLANFKDCKALRCISLDCRRVTAKGLAHFKDCKELRELSLNFLSKDVEPGLVHFENCKELHYLFLSSISDTGLSHFKGCENLNHLVLPYVQMTEAGFAGLKDFNALTTLVLWGPKVSDTSLAQLKDCKSLTELGLQSTSVTADGVAELSNALPQCRIIVDGKEVVAAKPPRVPTLR